LPPAIPALTDINARLNREQIESVVRQGRGPMPGFAKLPEEDVQSLVSFLLNTSGASALPALPATPPAADTKFPDAADSGAVRYLTGFGFMMTSTGVPAISPPWTSLTAYDLNKGTIKWKIPLGEVPDLAAKGVTSTGYPFPRTGPVVTAGGLVFTATRDHKVRAYDVETGKVLWEKRLDAALQGIPSVYQAGGREYLVVCAAAPEMSDSAIQGHIRGAYIAFALPRAAK
jgi:quinoprotein glucose dehydrogenase